MGGIQKACRKFQPLNLFHEELSLTIECLLGYFAKIQTHKQIEMDSATRIESE